MDRALNQSPLQLIRQALPDLNAAMTRVAEQILEHPQDVGRAPITRLAEQADTSPATVTRLAVLLGFEGYPALRAAIAEENGRGAQAGWEADIGRMIQPDDPADQVLNVLAGTQANALRNALGAIDLDAAGRLADAMAAATRIHIYGEWGDAIPAQELHIRLLRIGRPTWFTRDAQEAAVVSSLLGPSDVALVLSRSGRNAGAEELVRLARLRGATTAVITGMAESALAGAVDEVLLTGTPDGPAWTDYFAGRASDVLTAGLLWVLVAQRTVDSLEEAFQHGVAAQGRPPVADDATTSSSDRTRRQ
ncbi:MurR/RpiR family transcriptional regulator [Auraticoccus cholistanensis]|uniref:MurR/RpiR family transcriptional regulator n=1 Tax=Auraticoccus cholistanensis TaxID=2656650 RepID=UPI002F91534F